MRAAFADLDREGRNPMHELLASAFPALRRVLGPSAPVLGNGGGTGGGGVERKVGRLPAKILSTRRRLRNWSRPAASRGRHGPVAGDRLADGGLSARAPSGWAQGKPLKVAAASRSPAGRDGGAGSVRLALRKLTHSSCRRQRGGGDDGRGCGGGRSQSCVQASGSLGGKPPNACPFSWDAQREGGRQDGGLGHCRRRRCGTTGSRPASRAYSSRTWVP